MAAVEWLLENLISEPYSEEDFKYNEECWDRAIEMEKEQRERDFIAGNDSACMEHEDIKDYFNKYLKSN